MTALSESFSLMIICDVFSLLILTSLLFSRVGKPILDNIIELPLLSNISFILGTSPRVSIQLGELPYRGTNLCTCLPYPDLVCTLLVQLEPPQDPHSRNLG